MAGVDPPGGPGCRLPGFTGVVSSSPTAPSDGTAAAPAPVVPGPAAPVRPHWSPWREVTQDWRTLVTLLVGLAVIGAPLGVLWWGLAPRAEFRITTDGPVVIGNPSEELLAGDDAIFVLILGGLGLLAGLGAWLVRRCRGVAGLLGAALGTLAASAVAWRVGQLLGPAPTRAALRHVGGRVTTSLSLGSLPALAVAPFLAVLVYVIAALFVRSDALGRAVTSSTESSSLAPSGGSPRAPDGHPSGARAELARRGGKGGPS
jgi:hypothetical protein